MTANHYQDGPDGLHRLHEMLSSTYGVEIPSSDYLAAIALLDNLGLSLRGIEELMRRFTRNFRGQIRNDVNDVITEKHIVDERDVSRVRQLLTAHGYESFVNEPSPGWGEGSRELDPQEPNIPISLGRAWTSLQQAFPKGLRDPKDYVGVLAVLIDEQYSPMEVEILLSELTDRPKELISRDIDGLDSVLIVSEDEKVRVKSRLANKAREPTDSAGTDEL